MRRTLQTKIFGSIELCFLMVIGTQKHKPIYCWSRKTSDFCEGDNGNLVICSNRATKERGDQHENVGKRWLVETHQQNGVITTNKHVDRRKLLLFMASYKRLLGEPYLYPLVKNVPLQLIKINLPPRRSQLRFWNNIEYKSKGYPSMAYLHIPKTFMIWLVH